MFIHICTQWLCVGRRISLPKGWHILILGGNKGGISVDNMGEEYLWVKDAVGR